MQIFFYFFVLFFLRLTNQLKCVRVCQNHQLAYKQNLPNISSFNDSLCSTRSKPERCQGRLMIHYRTDADMKPDFHLQSIFYTFNRTNNIVDDEIEQLADQYQSKFLIYYLLSYQSNNEQFILTIYVLCRTHDTCAYDTIEKFIHSYVKSPVWLYVDIISYTTGNWKISCTNSITKCYLKQNEKCFYEKSNRFEHSSCIQSSFEQFEYEFFVTNKTIYKRRESLICNTDFCTNETSRKTIEEDMFSTFLSDYETYTIFNHSNMYSLFKSQYQL